MHTRAATPQTLFKVQLAQVKQNLLLARIAVLIVLVPVGLVGNSSCVRRSRQSSFETQSNRPAPAAEMSQKININTASASDLEKLPGVGEVLAERIVSHRTQHGPFRRVEHLMMVRGISERKFHGFRSMIKME